VSNKDKSIKIYTVKKQIKKMVAIIGTALHWSDILVLFVYFLLILGFGVWIREIKESSFDYLIFFRVHARIVAVLVRKDIFFFIDQEFDIFSFRWIFSCWSFDAFYTGKKLSKQFFSISFNLLGGRVLICIEHWQWSFHRSYWIWCLQRYCCCRF